MPQYRALKTFGTPKGKHGTVITGTVLTMTQKDADELNRHHPKDRPVVELYRGTTEPRESPKDKSLPGAPKTKGLRDDGPTFEEFVKAGYLPENYPPEGYAEKPSTGLDEYRAANPKKVDTIYEGEDPSSRPVVKTAKPDEGKAAGTGGPSVRVEGGQLGGGKGRRSSVLRVGRPLPSRK